jgi:hypothetical protein
MAKMTAVEATQKKLMEANWEKTITMRETLKELVKGGLLPAEEFNVWRATRR